MYSGVVSVGHDQREKGVNNQSNYYRWFNNKNTLMKMKIYYALLIIS